MYKQATDDSTARTYELTDVFNYSGLNDQYQDMSLYLRRVGRIFEHWTLDIGTSQCILTPQPYAPINCVAAVFSPTASTHRRTNNEQSRGEGVFCHWQKEIQNLPVFNDYIFVYKYSRKLE